MLIEQLKGKWYSAGAAVHAGAAPAERRCRADAREGRASSRGGAGHGDRCDRVARGGVARHSAGGGVAEAATLSRSVSLDDLGVDGDDLTWGRGPVGAGTALDAEDDPASRPHVARVSVDDLGVEGGGGAAAAAAAAASAPKTSRWSGDVEVDGGDGELRRSFAFSRSSGTRALSRARGRRRRASCARSPTSPCVGTRPRCSPSRAPKGRGAAAASRRGVAGAEDAARRRPSAEEVDAALEVLAAAAEEGTLPRGALSEEARPAIPRLAEVTGRLRRSSSVSSTSAVSPVGDQQRPWSVWTPHLGVEATPSPGRGVAVAPAAGGDGSYEPNYGITRAASIGVRSAQRGWPSTKPSSVRTPRRRRSRTSRRHRAAKKSRIVGATRPVRRASGAGAASRIPQPPPATSSPQHDDRRARKGNVERRRQRHLAPPRRWRRRRRRRLNAVVITLMNPVQAFIRRSCGRGTELDLEAIVAPLQLFGMRTVDGLVLADRAARRARA